MLKKIIIANQQKTKEKKPKLFYYKQQEYKLHDWPQMKRVIWTSTWINQILTRNISHKNTNNFTLHNSVKMYKCLS